MKKIIIIKYGELTTKKGNISFFINTLNENIKNALDNISNKIIFDRGRMFIYTDSFDEVINKLIKIFGIYEINIAYELDDNNIDNIGNNLINLLKDKEFKTFKVITKRSNKDYPIISNDVNIELGSLILNKLNDKEVDIHNPELNINIEIRKEKSYIYFEKIKGLGGYPVGTQSKGMLMLSGGIDSPVAGYLALKRGIRLEAVYFESPPHTSLNAKNKVLKLARELSNYGGYLKVHVVNFTNIQESIYKNIPHEYMITIMRRMMYRITEKLCYKENAKAIINGESVGQVASQTLTSMEVINEVVKLPVLRPVICFDKIEIVNLAKKINTYEISTLPYEDCCTLFVPKHPVINPTLEKAREFENLIPYENLINETLKTIETIKVTSNDKKYDNIL